MDRLAPLLLVLGCASGPWVSDVRASFDSEYAFVEVRPPAAREFGPARAANAESAMRDTEDLAREYLRRRPRDRVQGREVRALLACSYLLQGRTPDAVALLHGLRAPDPREDLPENDFIAAAVHAADACHAVDAYRDLLLLFEGEGTVEAYLERYGDLLDVRDREAEAREIKAKCFQEVEGDPRGLERVSRHRSALRDILAGQIYNDTAELLMTLPDPAAGNAPVRERCLASIAAGLQIVYAEVLPDLLPETLRQDQKDWLREQVIPFYERGKRKAGHFISDEERAGLDPASTPTEPRRLLYARLLRAGLAAEGWIQTR